MTHSNRNFDAPGPVSAFGSAVALIRADWRVFIALLVTATAIELIAAGVLCIDAIGSGAVDASIGSISIFAAVDPLASQAEVDALGPLIRATPGVAEAIFRSKDDAIKSLVARGLPPADGRNPLPDVWAARLDPARIGADRSVATVISEVRRGLAGLPRVESVTTDESWVRSTDRLAERWRHAEPLIWIGTTVLLSLVLSCAAFLAGGSLARVSSDAAQATWKRVLAIFGAVTTVLASLLGYAADWLIFERLNIGAMTTLQVSFGGVLVAHPGAVTGILALTVVILAGGMIAGHRRPR